MKRRVLVFGATGEIGGRIARLCADAGHEVTGVSRGKNTRGSVPLDGVRMLQGDKEDEDFLRRTHLEVKPEVVIDSVPRITSVEKFHRILKDVENFILCGSTGRYVPLRFLPADESHPWREDTGVNFYAQCKRDALALDLREREGFPVTILCPTNIIGEHRVPLDLWGGRDIEFFRALKAGRPLTIAPCENILLQSGYNTDLAGAFLRAVERPDEVRGETFIISCKRAITLGRYLETAMDYLGSKSEIRHVSAEELLSTREDISPKGLEFLLQHMCFDISKAERVLGYAPTLTAEQGLIKALEWCISSGIL